MSLARIGRGLGANAYDKLVVIAAQLLMVPLLTRAWGLAVYGCWVLLATAPSFLAVSDFGFATAAGTRMTMQVAQDDRAAAVRTFQSAWAMVLVSAALMALLSVAVALTLPPRLLPLATGFAEGEARATLLLLLFYGIVSLQSAMPMAGFRCAGLYALGVTWTATMILAENAAAALVVVAGGRPVAVAAALLLCRGIALIVQMALLHRRVPWLTPGLCAATGAEVKALAHPAMAVAALPIAQASFLQGTAIALGVALGVAAVPAFTVTRTLSRIGLQTTQLLTHALMPEFSVAVATGDRPTQARILVAVLATATAVALPFAAVLVLAGPWLIARWTGGVIHPPMALLVAMAATVVLGGLWNPVSVLILAMNRHAGFAYPFAALALLTVPVAFGLSRWIGPAGAGLSIAMLDAALCWVVWRLGRRCFVGADELRTAARATIAQAARLMRRRPA